MKSRSKNEQGNAPHEQKLKGALDAMRRAAKSAHRRAAAHGEKIAICRDGKVVWIDPIETP